MEARDAVIGVEALGAASVALGVASSEAAAAGGAGRFVSVIVPSSALTASGDGLIGASAGIVGGMGRSSRVEFIRVRALRLQCNQ